MWMIFLSNLPELVGLTMWSILMFYGGKRYARWRS